MAPPPFEAIDGSSTASSATGNRSPRSRHQSNRPKPFTIAMPTPSTHSFHHGSGLDQDFSAPHSTQPSRPQSPSFYRSTVAEVHSVLYGGRGKDKEEIVELVQDYYDSAAVFENPVSIAKGPAQIAEFFFLLGLLPGQMWSELMEVAESAGYDGGRLVVMTHVLHIATLPWLDPNAVPKSSVLHPSHSFYSSLPSTPYMTPTPLPGSPFSRTHPVTGKSSALWPIRAVISALNPVTVLSNLTTFHFKLHTRLRFNEQGKIISHEDTWGVKETIEGFLPILSHLYELQRKGVGVVATGASRMLFRGDYSGSRDEPAFASRPTEQDLAGSSFRHPQAASLAGSVVHEQQHQPSKSQRHHHHHHHHQHQNVQQAKDQDGRRDRQSSNEHYLRSGYYAPVSVSRLENELAMRLSPTSEKQRREAEALEKAKAEQGAAGHEDEADTSQVTTMDLSD